MNNKYTIIIIIIMVNLFLTPEEVSSVLSSPEVGGVDDIVVDQTCRMDHFGYDSHFFLISS